MNVAGSRAANNPKLLKTIEEAGEAAIYLFSRNDNDGLMLVSADDKTPALLGFSDSNVVDINNLPPSLYYWIEGYKQQIGYLRSHQSDNTSASTRTSDFTPIAPLLKTRWDQDEPYNNLCPKDGSSSSYTGCVATAMAQIMHYFKHPVKGTGSISYECTSLDKTLSMDFADITFDWDNMLDSYSGRYNSKQANAVAQLMVAAGYSVQMNYSETESGAVSAFVPGALVNYFGYDQNVRYFNRNQYSLTDWKTMIYDNLKNVGPVLYSGDSQNNVGHAFVCDGYQGDGYFHFNWGWSGNGDGYYLLDALSPSAIGIGGGDGGFNYNQEVALGIKPSMNGSSGNKQNEVFMYGSATGSVSGGSLNFMQASSSLLGWGYNGLGVFEFYLGLGVVKAGELSDSPKYFKASNIGKLQLQAGYWYPFSEDFMPTVNLNDLNLEAGVQYKIFNAYSQNGQSNWKEVEAPYGSYNYFYITKTNNNDYEIVNQEPLQFSISELKLETPLYAGNAFKANAVIANDNENELTRAVCLVLLNENNNIEYSSDSFVVTLQAGEKKQYEWASPLTNQTGVTIDSETQFYLGLYDLETNTIYFKSDSPVTMQPYPGKPEYSIKFLVEDAPFDRGYYLVDTPNDFNIITRVSVTSGVFSYPVTLAIFKVIPGTNTANLILSFPYDIEFINAGETKDLVMNINFPNASTDDRYCIDAFVEADGQLNIVDDPISTFFIVSSNGTTAVDKIRGKDSGITFIYDPASKILSVSGGNGGIKSLNCYSTSGTRLPLEYGGNSEINLSSLGSGVIIISATDGEGNMKSTKIAL